MKKILFSTLIVLLVSFLVGGIAYAADGEWTTSNALGGRLTYGEVTSIDSNQFTVQTGRGRAFTYLVDENTRFRSQDIEGPGFKNLEVGRKVAVASRSIDDELVARIVVLLPEDFDPSKRFEVRARGEISDINLAENSINLIKPSGDEMTFTVDENTRFLGQAASLEDVAVGWLVGVAGVEQEDGSLLASLIIATEQRRRITVAGTVTSVDLEADSFSMTTRQGEDQTFSVDENTRYRSRQTEIESLADLQPDMVVIVIGKLQTDGSYLAIQVAAEMKENLPNFDVKTGGTITSIASDSFTIQTKDGDEITFLVSDETRFRGRRIEVHGLDDLETGMVALVGGDELENGDILAKVVIGIPAP